MIFGNPIMTVCMRAPTEVSVTRVLTPMDSDPGDEMDEMPWTPEWVEWHLASTRVMIATAQREIDAG